MNGRGFGMAMMIGLGVSFNALSQTPVMKLDTMRLEVASIKWNDASDTTKIHTTVVAGDPNRASYYTVRVLIPRGLRLMPHFHPDSRMVTVISGTLWFGYGTAFDPSRMKPLSAAGFFTEPAGQPHFAWAKDGDVIVQATGFGPSATTYVQSDSTLNRKQ
jgi:quercetin dioxygenase-like cupin family protein